MRELSSRATGAALLGTALLLAGCGDGADTAATNNAAAPVAGANSFRIGNDASAMETVGSGSLPAGAQPLPMGNTADAAGNAMTGNSAAPASDSGGRAGNSATSNVSGM